MPSTVRFGPFELSVETGELRKNGLRLKLSGQPIKILTLLVSSPGQLVSRDELQRCLWPGNSFGDFETGLNAAVNRLREYLNDSATEPKYIETVPGRGYRFIGKLEGLSGEVGPGVTVSHYQILENIGCGGMGIVYKGRDLRLGRHVALKFLPKELATNNDALERFRREASTASSLNHPNICTIYEIEEHEDQPFIVMELLQGQTLRESLIFGALRHRIDEVANRVDIDQFLDIAIQTTDGLQAAHAKGIIHRDIKPTNIFITYGGMIKILDFGLAKFIGSSELASTWNTDVYDLREATREFGPPVGTFGYMAPEQVRCEELDGRADLFSFGVILYEMATSHQPFKGANDVELCHAILTKAPVAIHDLNASFPPALEQVIHKAMDQDRELRYQSASELYAELVRIREEIKPARAPNLPLPESQPQTRFLEAAAPREATVGLSVEVVAMVREDESAGGLRAALRFEKSPNLTAEDVRERPFLVEFPLDDHGRPQPLDITLRLESPGFDPPSQTKKLRVPPKGDSPACTFLVVPCVIGEHVMNLELIDVEEQVLASRSIRVQALSSGADISPQRTVVTIPFLVLVGVSPIKTVEADTSEGTELQSFGQVFTDFTDIVSDVFSDVGTTDRQTESTTLPRVGNKSGPIENSVRDVAVTLSAEAVKEPRKVHWPRRMLLTLTGFSFVLILAVAFQLRLRKASLGTSETTSQPASPPPGSPGPQQYSLRASERVVLGDFTNSTGDAALDRLSSPENPMYYRAWNPSPRVEILSPDQLTKALKLMNGKHTAALDRHKVGTTRPGEPLTPALAREVCVYAQANVVITGSISTNGAHYKIAATATNCQTGQILETTQVEANKPTGASADVKRSIVSTALISAVEQLLQKLPKPPER